MSRFKNPPSQMTHAEFMSTFSDIYEHSPWVAQSVWEEEISKEHDEIEALASVMAGVVETAGEARKAALIKAHPDLAGKAAVQDNLTEASTSEQAGAGLDDCTPEEFEQFQSYNKRYKAKFGFPFIKAVKNSNRLEIIAGFEERLGNSAAEEFKTALAEIDKIARFRLMEL
ncbi:MAG: OHCU decarboxylase [Sneathiella sp.]|nr:MAG: OHCU decarboxylase [Sneathiella sp.]